MRLPIQKNKHRKKCQLGVIVGLGVILSGFSVQAQQSTASKLPTAKVTLSWDEYSAQLKATPPQKRLGFLLAHTDDRNERVVNSVASELGEFDDSRAIAALKKLAQRPTSPAQGEHIRLNNIPLSAYFSLERIETRPIIARFATLKTAVEMEPIIQNIKARRSEGPVHAIRQILNGKVKDQPDVIVPLLMRYFFFDSEDIVAQYPAITIPLLRSRFLDLGAGQSTEYVVRLARRLKAYEYLPLLVSRLTADSRFGRSSNSIWKSDAATSMEIQAMMVEYGDKSLPLLEGLLYSGNQQGCVDAIYVLGRINTPASLQMLRDLQTNVQGQMAEWKQYLKTDFERNEEYRELVSLDKTISGTFTYALSSARDTTKAR